jgi:phosphatidylglycerophosphate synthase
MTTESPYTYSSSTKSRRSDELINTYFLRPLAGLLVRVLYRTPVTPNQVTTAAIASGFVSAYLYLQGTPEQTLLAGIFLTVKDFLDTADGQLARARNLFSRRGRFFDSIGDVVVNFTVFCCMGVSLRRTGLGNEGLLLSLIAFLFLTLRVSYHVFYQTSFLHLEGRYETNRTSEEVNARDLGSDPWTLRLQQIYLLCYGWQDRMMAGLDRWSRRGKPVDPALWYADPTALRLSGLLGLGSELFLLMICSVTNVLPFYLLLNILVMNGVWGGCVVYRRVLAGRLQAQTT